MNCCGVFRSFEHHGTRINLSILLLDVLKGFWRGLFCFNPRILHNNNVKDLWEVCLFSVKQEYYSFERKMGMGNVHLLKRTVSWRLILREAFTYDIEVIKTSHTQVPLEGFLYKPYEPFLLFYNHSSKRSRK